jgi:hypothetical protein
MANRRWVVVWRGHRLGHGLPAGGEQGRRGRMSEEGRWRSMAEAAQRRRGRRVRPRPIYCASSHTLGQPITKRMSPNHLSQSQSLLFLKKRSQALLVLLLLGPNHPAATFYIRSVPPQQSHQHKAKKPTRKEFQILGRLILAYHVTDLFSRCSI